MPGGPEWSFVSVEMRGLHIRCGWPLDPLHAMQFRAGHSPRSGAGVQPNGHLEVTVTVRW
jgi:hypothetical protein